MFSVKHVVCHVLCLAFIFQYLVCIVNFSVEMPQEDGWAGSGADMEYVMSVMSAARVKF